MTDAGTMRTERLVSHEPDSDPRTHVCNRCLMDASDPDIVFDDNGVCNHCHRYEELVSTRLFKGPEAKRAREALSAKIKAEGAGKPYDCVIGVSGGVDSTYAAYVVKQLGLRPIAVHLDNGWDSELAVANIEKTLCKLDIDLYTYVIDWEEFRDLQLAFLEASTPDAEVPTDHAILAILYQIAAKHNTRHVILGTNVISEATMPLKWGYGYYDLKYIKAVHQRFGKATLRTYPRFGLAKLFYYLFLRRIRTVSILNYIDYDKATAMETIQRELGWVYYGGKHYESIYTRFFQAYILPRKFDIDKRKAHYSNLICSGQLSRAKAVEMLRGDTFPADQLEQDKEYVIKKLRLTAKEFEAMMVLSPRTFFDYPNQYRLFNRLKGIQKALAKFM